MLLQSRGYASPRHCGEAIAHLKAQGWSTSLAMHEMAAVASVCPRLTEAALARLERARAMLPQTIEPIDFAQASSRLAMLLAEPTVQA